MSGEVRVNVGETSAAEKIREGMESAAVINYTADYAPYVEFPTSYTGTQPPFDPIFEWVDRKWPDLDSGLKDAGLPDSDRTITTDEQKRNVAWIVVKSIAENGTDGVFFARRGLDLAKQKASAVAQQYQDSDDPQAGEKIVAETAEVGFNKSQAIISQEATDTGNLLQSGMISMVEDPDELPSNPGGSV